ncbi:MAG: hypothetical protein P4L81_04970 [Candidatus Pacebacteria bacterium]|nr:hypothetical protein [Candidatus Paceibacterota bacterium]
MKKNIILAAMIATLSCSSIAFAQSTVSGTLSAGGGAPATTTSSTTTVTGTVTGGNSLTGTVSNPSLTGTVGNGNSLTGTVTGSSGGGGGGGGGGGSIGNGPPVGGGGGGPGYVIVCPNLSDPYTLPSGYGIVGGNCEPLAAIGGAGGSGNPGGTSTSTSPGIPNTGAGGNAQTTALVLAISGVISTFAGTAVLRRRLA